MSTFKQLCGAVVISTHTHRYIDPIDFVNSLSLKHNEQQVLAVCNIRAYQMWCDGISISQDAQEFRNLFLGWLEKLLEVSNIYPPKYSSCLFDFV